MIVNGINIFYEDLGSKDGNVIVFLNGVMASTSSWYDIAKPFVKMGYRVILHDFKGQLKSDKPSGIYSFIEHANETIILLEKLGIKKAHFIGTSYGGEVAMKIAANYPNYVETLSIINSVSQLDDALIGKLNHWIDLAKLNDGYNFFWKMAADIYHEDYIKNNSSFLEERATKMSVIDKSYFEGQITLYKTFLADVEMTNELKNITARTLVICGENDLLKPVKFSKIIHDNIVNSEYVTFPDCGHVTIFEKPNELITTLLGFIVKSEI